jgi:iron complex outermembrane receptor protein
MSISWRSTFGSFSLAAILTTGGCLCSAASPSNEQPSHDEHETRFTINAGVAPAHEHASDLRLLTGYNADPGECGDVMLGPLPKGQYSGKEAWLKLIAPVCSLVERPDPMSKGTKVFADMSECKCSFGLPRLTHLQQGHVLVTSSSLPGLDEYIASQVRVIDRKRIVETGATSIPDLLRYISQTAFHRGRGFRASGAQYAELRGLGAAYTLVLLNGRRTLGTAADFATNAFDLSNIPMSAVERVEISMDANSLVHGMDAIGGIVNVVLKNSVEPDINVRYGSASGGASQGHASISGGAIGGRGRVSMYFDAEKWSELLGRERDRWNDQDFTRFGGPDYRSRFASPANVSSMDGQNLPGLDAPFAAAELDPATGTFDFIAGRRNSSSLRAFQGIVPQGSRATISANGSLSVGASVVSLELLDVRRENELQLIPSIVPGYTWSANHPENPFAVPVRVEAVLAGFPAQRQHFETNSRRGVAAIDGPLGDWQYSAFVVRSDERAKAHMLNATDPVALARALQPADASEALSLYSRVPRSAVPEGLIVDTPVGRYHASATHVQASIQGSLLGLMANLGIEHRHESMAFGAHIADASRGITSPFVHVRVPLVDPTMNIRAAKDLQLLLGARRDDYSDIGDVTKTQFGLTWRITEAIKLQASTSESFRPPSLVDLYFPRMSVPVEIFDARRGQTGPVELSTGGNPDLLSTTGRSNSVGVSFDAGDGLRLSAEYWRVKVRGHISLLAPMALLAHEDSALDSRIVRALPTATDEASGRPGRLLHLDVSRANVGGAATQGVDLAAEAEVKTGIGSFTPRLSVTLTDEFAFSDLPITQMRLENRAGVASEFGTIPARRGVASLTYESNEWRACVHARVISSYRDRSAITGEPMQRMVPGGAVWDLNVSKVIVGNLRLTLGAFNVTNREPPFAHSGGSLGFDTSQGDLVGREIYGALSGMF